MALDLWPSFGGKSRQYCPVSRPTSLNYSGTPFATGLSLSVVTADLIAYKKKRLSWFQWAVSHFQRPSTSIPMLSLRALIAVLATASLSSTVAAQTTIPNWGLCGGSISPNPLKLPCADGWICVVYSEDQCCCRNPFHETHIPYITRYILSVCTATHIMCPTFLNRSIKPFSIYSQCVPPPSVTTTTTKSA